MTLVYLQPTTNASASLEKSSAFLQRAFIPSKRQNRAEGLVLDDSKARRPAQRQLGKLENLLNISVSDFFIALEAPK